MKLVVFIWSIALLFPFSAQSLSVNCSEYKISSLMSMDKYGEYLETGVEFQLKEDKITAQEFYDLADKQLAEASQWATLYIAFCKD